MIERRKNSRANIHCRVFFQCCDAHDKEASQNMGMALDISEKGMLVESSIPIHASTIKVMVPIKDKDTVEVMGTVIYSMPTPDKRYRTGIIFHEPGDDMAGLVKILGDKPETD
jgi:hypothetical protein